MTTPQFVDGQVLTASQLNEGFASLLKYVGGWDASTNNFPDNGDGTGSGGTILAGNLWSISTAGDISGYELPVGASIYALTDAPGQIISNWGINPIGYVANANKVFAGPATGADAAPSFRELVLDDLPAGIGGVTSVDASGGVETSSGSPITVSGTIQAANVINAQTGTSYAIVAGDRWKHLTFSNPASIAATIAQAGTTGFEDGYGAIIENLGVGAVTITPTTSTINGAASYVLTSNTKGLLYSDGTNYRVIAINPHGIAVNNQTGTSYTFASGDAGSLVTFSNAASIAGTLPQATGAFTKFWCWVENRGVGTLTITPTTSTIDGTASISIATNTGVLIVSDGTNYFTCRGGVGMAVLSNQNIFTNQQAVTPYRANISGTVSIDLSATAKSNTLILKLTGNVTSFAFTNAVDGAVYNLWILQDSTGGWTFSIPSTWKFTGGQSPVFLTTANAINFVSLQWGTTEGIYVASALPALS